MNNVDKVKLLAPALVFNALGYAGVLGINALLAEDTPNDLNWVLKMVVAPMGLMQAVVFEAQAIQRIPAGKGPTDVLTEKSSKEFLMKRIADQSFEQTLMTLLTVISLTFVEGDIAGINGARLGVSCAYMYLIGRPLFALGYLTADENNRLPGLFIGGFWLNLGYMLFSVLVLLGWVANTNAAWYTCVAGAPVLTAVAIFFALPSATEGAGDANTSESQPLADDDKP